MPTGLTETVVGFSRAIVRLPRWAGRAWGRERRCPRGGRPIRLESCARFALLLLTVAGPAAAQSTVTVSGRVTEAGDQAGIAGAVVALGGREAITDIAGHFSLDASPGEQVLSARAFGYALHEQSVVLRVDTTVAIALQPTPVELDPLMVENRTVTVRGEVYEAGTDIGLLGVDIIAGAEEDVTNGVGRFKVDAPAGPPVRLSVRAFGYLPIETMVSVFEDTTFVFELERDPIMQQMIARQVTRIEERAKPRLTTIMPAMDREYLVRNRNATALDLIRYRYGQFLTRVRCILIDDRQTYNGLGELALYLPDELERIEVLERGQMLRIYTRDFIRDMVSGEVYLPTPVITPSRRPLCR